MPASEGVRDGGEGKILIYDIAGRTIALYQPKRAADGSLYVEWDRRGRGGERVHPGVYFARWENGRESASGKVIVVD